MTYFLHDGIDHSGVIENVDVNQIFSTSSPNLGRDSFHFVRDKMETPKHLETIDRPRINETLRRSVDQFPATLITGRAGTGKTALAARFASNSENVSWYSLESSDKDWPIFCRYFARSISLDIPENLQRRMHDYDPENFGETDVARYLLNGFSGFYGSRSTPPRLLVMDDIHHVFDAPWFDDFFKLLLYALPSETHLLMLCRSKPPGPLWRLRSKQMLNVLDERIIAFTENETKELFKSRDIPADAASEAHRRCYGRISKLLQFADLLSSGTVQFPALNNSCSPSDVR